MYNDYIEYIKKIAGYEPHREKIEVISNLEKDDYVKNALVAKFLAEGILDDKLAKILLTKAMINNYI